ncbi:MAG: hypothetical protein IH603_10450 [Burkholderia vietnamiensis]|nr:hypothetical protein [Burkholderia vietnamiensis]
MALSVSPRFTTYFRTTRIGAAGGTGVAGSAAAGCSDDGPASVSLGGTGSVLAQPAMTSTAARPGSQAALRYISHSFMDDRLPFDNLSSISKTERPTCNRMQTMMTNDHEARVGGTFVLGNTVGIGKT